MQDFFRHERAEKSVRFHHERLIPLLSECGGIFFARYRSSGALVLLQTEKSSGDAGGKLAAGIGCV